MNNALKQNSSYTGNQVGGITVAPKEPALVDFDGRLNSMLSQAAQINDNLGTFFSRTGLYIDMPPADATKSLPTASGYLPSIEGNLHALQTQLNRIGEAVNSLYKLA